jgi:SAM-dependent methyltransferase
VADHAPRTIERHCDVCVVGGSAAGLAAALELGRRRLSVLVVDAEEPRSVPADRKHGDLAREAIPPSTAAGREEVRSHGGEILAGRVSGVNRVGAQGFRIELTGGHSIVARRVLAATTLVAPFTSIGLRPTAHPSGLGDVLATDASGATAVHGVYAAGDAADGSRVGATIGSSLADDDLGNGGRRSAAEDDWDHRYEGRQLWSGNANGTLVKEVTGMTPGRALDVGAGEGGDAIWLAEHGWQVTANDISRRALDRIAAEAGRRGLPVECLAADANATEPFGSSTFDLVSAQYASIPRTPDHRALRNILGAVAPGGTLLIVGHDLEPMRRAVDTHATSRPFDPEAYLGVEHVAHALSGSADWTIEVHEKRPRPAGAASGSHHVDDIVLRARRTPT